MDEGVSFEELLNDSIETNENKEELLTLKETSNDEESNIKKKYVMYGLRITLSAIMRQQLQQTC